MTDWKEVENELKKLKKGEDYTVEENSTGTRIYTIKSREAKKKLRIMVFGSEGYLEGPKLDKEGNKSYGLSGIGGSSEDKKTDYWYEEGDENQPEIFKIVSGEDKIKKDEEKKREQEERKRKAEEFWKNPENRFSDIKNAIEKNLEKAKQRNEKCANCNKKITNCRIIFSKNKKTEGPYCSGKCAENSTLKNEIQSSFDNQKVDNSSVFKNSTIKKLLFFGLISILPLIITALTIYLLNKKKKI